MSDQNDSFNFKAHEHYGEKLKLAHKYLEQLRADLIRTYEKSSSKEAKQLEAAMDKIRLVQTSLHGRVLAEFKEKNDSDILPIYLGRLSPDK
jgi:hypothetical protein